MIFDFRNLGNGFETEFSYIEQKDETEQKEIPKTGRNSIKTGLKTDTVNKKITQLMSDNQHITIPEIATEIGKSKSTTNERIAKLQKAGHITRIGTLKGGYWQVNKNKIKKLWTYLKQ